MDHSVNTLKVSLFKKTSMFITRFDHGCAEYYFIRPFSIWQDSWESFFKDSDSLKAKRWNEKQCSLRNDLIQN